MTESSAGKKKTRSIGALIRQLAREERHRTTRKLEKLRREILEDAAISRGMEERLRSLEQRCDQNSLDIGVLLEKVGLCGKH